MGTLPPHNLAMLSEEDSWELFQKRAFGESEETQQFVEIGRKIVNKCAGLPLALKAIGALMRYKREVCEWHAIAENNIWGDEASTNEILPALKLSYDHLSGYMKHCFAFCATFPQDYEIEKETLIQLWMANDFIPTNEMSDLEGKGRDIFDELCRRSFFQDITERDNGYSGRRTICKMHDLIHDLAKHIAGKQCAAMLEVACGHVLHLSIFSFPSPDNMYCVLKEYPIIRTFLISRNFAKESEDRRHSKSLKSIQLRALQIGRFTEQLPKELGLMKHLRYLDLSDGMFGSLPEIISALYNLQTLKLSNSHISKLPDDMRYMVCLRHLFIDGCHFLKRMPIGLGQLRYLRTLTNYMAECGPGRTVAELNNLNLYGHLRLSGLENVRDGQEANAANMVSKINLSSLILEWDYWGRNSDSIRNDQEVLDCLRPPSELRALSVKGYAGFDIPVWMMNTFVLRNLRKLSFVNCCNCKALPPFWCLSLLEELELEGMKSLVYICSSRSIDDKESDDLPMFPRLKLLHVSELENLKGWHEKNDKLLTFSRLEKLTIKSCPKIRTIPCAPLLRDLTISELRGIKLFHISSLTMVASSVLNIECESSMEYDAFRAPKNVVKMSVTGLENVIQLDEEDEDDEESCQTQTLRDLTIKEGNFFFSCGPSKMALGFWKHFASLETLCIERCSALSLWPEQEFGSLKCLKTLCIKFCFNFTCLSEVSSSTPKKSYGEDILPRLETLEIWYCEKLVGIPRCCRSLKTLQLQECPSVSKEGLNWLKNLHELKKLELIKCKGLKSFPEGMESLISIEQLIMWGCPGIDSFPEGLQQRLSALQYLFIKKSPVLVRRCRSGGDYHHLVSAIPQVRLY